MPLHTVGKHTPVPVIHLLYRRHQIVDRRWSYSEIVDLFRKARQYYDPILQGIIWGNDEPGEEIPLAAWDEFLQEAKGKTVPEVISCAVSHAFGGKPRPRDILTAEMVVAAAEQDSRFAEELEVMDRTKRVKGPWQRIRSQQKNGEAQAELAAAAQEIGRSLPGFEDLNKVHCAKVEEVLAKLPDACASAVLVDPPYGNGFTFANRREQPAKPRDYWAWFEPIYRNLYRILKPGGFFLCLQPHPYVRCLWKWYGSVSPRPRVQLFPAGRLRGGSGGAAAPGIPYDPAVCFYKPGAGMRKPARPGSPRDFFVPRELPFVEARKYDCAKPPDLCSYIVEGFTEENGLVVVPFSGVGSFELACKKSGRPYLGIEEEEELVKIARVSLGRITSPQD
jgi:SAM-dependent methyltransferase